MTTRLRATAMVLRRLCAGLLVAGITTLAAPTMAWAQAGSFCAWSVGVGGNYALPTRSFSLLTPEDAWSVTPVLSSQCTVSGEGMFRPWVGVDAVPTMQHRYRRLAAQGSLFVLGRFGTDVRIRNDLFAGAHIVTNFTAWGFGSRVVYLPPPREIVLNRRWIQGFELRFGAMSGETIDLQAMLLVHVANRWVGDSSEEDWLPESRQQISKPWHVAVGFELGLVTGFRAQLTPGVRGKAPELGLRAGALSNLGAGAAVQPLATSYVDVPIWGMLQLGGDVGITRREGAAGLVTGLHVELDDDGTATQVHLGGLVGTGPGGEVWGSADAGLSWMW